MPDNPTHMLCDGLPCGAKDGPCSHGHPHCETEECKILCIFGMTRPCRTHRTPKKEKNDVRE